MRLLFPIIIFCLFTSCQYFVKQNSCNQVTPEDLKVMHHIIERSNPDTVEKYINYYINKLDLPVSALDIPDGEYYGETPYDDYRYKHVLRLKIEDEKFIEVEYDEIKLDRQSKKYDMDYCKKMNINFEGSAPNISYAKYENQLLEKQNLNDLDAVTGATYSLYRFKLAAIYALNDK
ncbi:hypothetical protein ACFLTE_07220 [Bacteroidota bacterium]